MKHAHPERFALAVLTLVATFAGCGSPVSLEEKVCPCLDEDGYVCCQSTGKCIRAGATCPRPDGAGGPEGGAPGAAVDVPGPPDPEQASDGGSGVPDAPSVIDTNGTAPDRPRQDSSVANELTVDRWTAMPRENAPSTRAGATAVWTGREMIVWGGGGDGVSQATGGRYDPAADRWTTMTTLRAPTARSGHSAVWTGKEMIVWGGFDGNALPLDTGARYDPETDSWTPLGRVGAPAARGNHLAFWTASQMFIWAGNPQHPQPYANGGRYDPATDGWVPINTAGAPDVTDTARIGWGTRSLWTGTDLIVLRGWGPENPFFRLDEIHAYRPVLDAWRSLPSQNPPRPRSRNDSVWIGNELIVWGGMVMPEPDEMPPGSGGGPDTRPPDPALREGAVFDPQTGTWRPMSQIDQPQLADRFLLVFASGAGSRGTGLMLVYQAPFQGGAYDPASDQWWPMSMQGAVIGHSVVWTGRYLLVWDSVAQAGARYEP
jgi:hypothetical protein